MIKPRIVFAETAARKIRKLPSKQRRLLIEQVTDSLSVKSSSGFKPRIELVHKVRGTDYVAIKAGQDVVLARPLTGSERDKFTPESDEAYFVADVLPEEELQNSDTR